MAIRGRFATFSACKSSSARTIRLLFIELNAVANELFPKPFGATNKLGLFG